MIKLSFDQAVAFYVLFFVVVFIGGWAFTFFKQSQRWYPKEFKLWQCIICGFVYSSVFDLNMTVCPRCGSYNKKEEESQ
jgi:hypothetical protein